MSAAGGTAPRPAQEGAAGRAAGPVLEARGVSKRFGGLVAVERVDLAIAPGTVHSLIGPNGAGKTTLFNMITGIYRPDEGDILFRGRSVAGLPPEKVAERGISRTFQNVRLFKELTALENVLVGMHLHLRANFFDVVLHTPRVEAEERRARREARELLAAVGLGGLGDELAKNLPYGHQRRLEIARALAVRPALLLLDEPAAGMNPRETEAVMELIDGLRRERGLTILLIEHDMKVVMGISDVVTVLDHGAKIAEGPPDAIRRDPRVIEAYLGKAVER